MDELLIGIGSALLLAAGFFALRPLLLSIAHSDARRQAASPIPAKWISLLDAAVPATRHPRTARDPRKWVWTNERDRPFPELGETWGNGIIVISWDAVSEGARDPSDGHNVVLHEFAHELAYEYDLTPAGVDRAWKPRVENPDTWSSTLQRAYERLDAKVEAHAPSVMSDYGSTDVAEFFAVATEVFFERPDELGHEDPELYDLLCTFYRQNPAKQLTGRER